MNTETITVKISIDNNTEKRLSESEMTKFTHFCTGLDAGFKELFYPITKITIKNKAISSSIITPKHSSMPTTVQSYIEDHFKFIPKKIIAELQENNFHEFHCELHKPVWLKVQLEKTHKNLFSKIFHS
ncbi:MAG: hypothetical protein OHK0036_18800 [Bacteroidia bacterium]